MLKDLLTDDVRDMFFPKKAIQIEKDLWMDKYKPYLISELAVHKNKITELETCIQTLFTKKASILLLTGPSGSAKTTTLSLIAKKLNFEVQEWVNPLSDDFIPKDDDFSGERIYSESQQAKFEAFLFRASRYDSLCFSDDTNCDLKIFLVKDFPNFLFKDPNKLRELLLKYNKISFSNPLVFIVTDTEQTSSLKRKLFPLNMLTELAVEVFKFNPIAPTSMMKALQRIIHMTSSTHSSKQDLEEIIQQSNGDVRSACNALQFLCTRTKHSSMRLLKKTKRVLKEKNTRVLKDKKTSFLKNKSESSFEHNKDVGISLFRVLGKILHCKRLPDTGASEPHLPKHLQQHKRLPMSFDPDKIFEKSCLSFDLFSSFLHQNYPSFFSRIEDMSSASDYFSETDTFSSEWSFREKMLPYQASLVTRGIMFAHHPLSPKSTWMPLHKPQMLSVSSKRSELSHLIRDHFTNISRHCNLTQLSTELLPSWALINHHASLNHQQKQILHDLSHFRQSCRPERFNEKDAFEGDTSANLTSEHFLLSSETYSRTLSTQNNKDASREKLEDFIEEGDSDD